MRPPRPLSSSLADGAIQGLLLAFVLGAAMVLSVFVGSIWVWLACNVTGSFCALVPQ